MPTSSKILPVASRLPYICICIDDLAGPGGSGFQILHSTVLDMLSSIPTRKRAGAPNTLNAFRHDKLSNSFGGLREGCPLPKAVNSNVIAID